MAIRPPRARKNPPQPSSRYHGRRMSEAEYLALPEEKPYLEYVDGLVLQKPMPNDDHAALIAELALILGLYRRGHGGRVRVEMRTRFPNGSFRIPDASYWAPGQPSGDDSIPTLAVEVRSPGQTMDELRAKCRFYRRNGVGVCWLIDPESRTAESFEGEADGLASGIEEELRSVLLPGFTLVLKDLFAVLDS